MADTVRNLTDLQTLLADNNSRAISPQDVRDFLVSAYRYPVMVQTLSAEYTATSLTETTICSQTFAMSLGGICEASWRSCIIRGTVGANVVDEYVSLKIDNVALDNQRIVFDTTNMSIGSAPRFQLNLMAYETLTAAQTHSITVTRQGYATSMYPVRYTYPTLNYKLFDMG